MSSAKCEEFTLHVNTGTLCIILARALFITQTARRLKV